MARAEIEKVLNGYIIKSYPGISTDVNVFKTFEEVVQFLMGVFKEPGEFKRS